MFKLPVIVWGLAALLLAAAAVAAGLTPARAHNDAPPPAAPANARVADGATAGAVVMAWDAVDGAAFYRIGWVAMDDIPAVRAEGREWLDAFVFADVANRGQTAYTIMGLVPGRDYAFIAASVAQRFGVGAWSEWAYLTPAGVASCPAGGGGEPTPEPPATPAAPAPTATPAAMPTATPAPTATPTPRPVAGGAGGRSYDADGDGLIEVSNLAQLAAIRADLNGDGASPAPAYAAAFPEAMAGMGCPDSGCTGYELVADLDFDTNGNGEADEGDAYWNDGAGWIPIGDEAHKFTADFDGNGHTIANLYISRRDTNHVGLFGYTLGNSIKPVGIVSATVSGKSSVGGLVGSSRYGAISGSYVTGAVFGNGHVGGLVGYSLESTIGNSSYATGSVSGGSWGVGGLVGGSEFGTISGSYATGSVSGESNVGGLVGYSLENTIGDSYATGSVSGEGNVGGLAGHSVQDIIIRNSYATGSISGTDCVGGLVGCSEYGTISGSYATSSVSGGDYTGGLVGSSGVTISGSYATGSVSGDDYVGGLVGSSYGTISGSYAIGDVSGGGDDIGGLVGRKGSGTITASYAAGRVSTSGDTFYIGGLVGYAEGSNIVSSYWDTQASGQASSYGGVGQTTAELQSPTGYTGIYAGWNLDLDGDGEGDKPWDFGGPGQYPVLQYGGLDVGAQRR